MRKRVLAANWKMNLSAGEIRDYFRLLLEDFVIEDDMEALFFVPYPYLPLAADLTGQVRCAGVGAQDLYWESSGAFTGEVSADMISDTGAEFVLIGHSERRKYFGETNETVNRKLKAALAASLKPILCLGETRQEREAGETEDVTRKSLIEGVDGIDPVALSGIYIAYEPVWAIGTGVTATPVQAEEVHAMLREAIASRVNAELAESIPILYGGSANPSNTAALMSEPDIDGLLVGGASLDPGKFGQMIACCTQQGR